MLADWGTDSLVSLVQSSVGFDRLNAGLAGRYAVKGFTAEHLLASGVLQAKKEVLLSSGEYFKLSHEQLADTKDGKTSQMLVDKQERKSKLFLAIVWPIIPLDNLSQLSDL